MAVHLYSTSDTTPYTFKEGTTCQANSCTGGCNWGELGGFLVSYRAAADPSQSTYTAYGYRNDYASTSSNTFAIAPPNDTLISTIFSGAAEQDDIATCESWGPGYLSGSPALTIESTLTPNCGVPDFLVADIWTGAANGANFGPYGLYSPAAGSGTVPSYALPAWQVVIPPLANP